MENEFKWSKNGGNYEDNEINAKIWRKYWQTATKIDGKSNEKGHQIIYTHLKPNKT